MDKQAYMKVWREKNKEKLKQHKRDFYYKNKKRLNARNYEWKKELFEKCPWEKTLQSIRSRLCDKNRFYSRYGIKNFLTADDLKYLWFRDKAYEMDCPSIDRIDGYGHYTLDNCRYLEYYENITRPKCYRKTSW